MTSRPHNIQALVIRNATLSIIKVNRSPAILYTLVFPIANISLTSYPEKGALDCMSPTARHVRNAVRIARLVGAAATKFATIKGCGERIHTEEGLPLARIVQPSGQRSSINCCVQNIAIFSVSSVLSKTYNVA